MAIVFWTCLAYNWGNSVSVERFLQTLKIKIFKNKTAYNSKSYLDYLNNLVEEYNNCDQGSLCKNLFKMIIHLLCLNNFYIEKLLKKEKRFMADSVLRTYILRDETRCADTSYLAAKSYLWWLRAFVAEKTKSYVFFTWSQKRTHF